MIRVICQKCREQSSASPEEGRKEGYLEINLNNDTWYYKCPYCQFTSKFQIKNNPPPLPKIRRQR